MWQIMFQVLIGFAHLPAFSFIKSTFKFLKFCLVPICVCIPVGGKKEVWSESA